MTIKKTREVVKLYNVGCEHCAKVCDKALGDRHYAYAEFKNGTLYVDIKDSVEIIPAVHLLEYFVSNGYEIDKVIIPKFNGDLASVSNDTAVCETHDISKWKKPNKTSYLIVNRRDGVYAEDVLNIYKDTLMQSSKNGTQIEFPRDVLLLGASKSQMGAMKYSMDMRSIQYIERPKVGLGFIGENVSEPSVINQALELPKVQLRESINMYPDILHLLNKEHCGRQLTENEPNENEPETSIPNIFRTLNMINTGRPLERKRTKNKTQA